MAYRILLDDSIEHIENNYYDTAEEQIINEFVRKSLEKQPDKTIEEITDLRYNLLIDGAFDYAIEERMKELYEEDRYRAIWALEDWFKALKAHGSLLLHETPSTSHDETLYDWINLNDFEGFRNLFIDDRYGPTSVELDGNNLYVSDRYKCDVFYDIFYPIHFLPGFEERFYNTIHELEYYQEYPEEDENGERAYLTEQDVYEAVIRDSIDTETPIVLNGEAIQFTKH